MADTPIATPDVSAFWRWFAAHHTELFDIVSGRRSGRVTELMDRALADHGIALTYEITRGSLGGELTFTPEGDPGLGRFVDYFVSKAPALEGWAIYGRVQRKPLAVALGFVKAIHGIDLSDAHFKLVVLDEKYHLCFLHDGLFARSEDERWSIAGTFLDHALGEDVVMTFVGELDFRKSGGGVQMGLLVNEIIRETESTDVRVARPNLDEPAR